MMEIRNFLLDLFREFAPLSPELDLRVVFFNQKGADIVLCKGSEVEFKHQTDKGFQLIFPSPTNLRELLVLFDVLLTSETTGVVLYYKDLIGQEQEMCIEVQKLRKTFDLLKEKYCKLYNIDLKPEGEEEVEIEIRKPDGTVIVERLRLP